MSEIVVVSNSGNKRKRRSSIDDEKDIENQRPPTKKIYSSAGDAFDFGKDNENINEELDGFPLAGTQSVHLKNKIDGNTSKHTASRSNQSSNGNIITNNNNTNHNNNISSNTNANHSSNNNSSVLTATIADVGSVEMTPQSLKKSHQWNASQSTSSCHKCRQAADYRTCPLPVLSWANAKDVWRFMCEKDKKTVLDRDSKMLHNHNGLQPRMRAILLDWLNEVCEVYKLHRETYYLALDYLDRYLSTNVRVTKTCLQLIGITCLFIAAKVEEIYPPKLQDFAYVTDGACTAEDILQRELIILTALEWQISPVTIIGWLGIYMQLNASKRTPKTIASANTKKSSAKSQLSSTSSNSTEKADDAFVFPQFSGIKYAITAQLIDLCTLDVGIANYSYSVIAAAAISHTFDK